MSYAKKGLDGSDVYVYATGYDWICQECPLVGAGNVHCDSPSDMLRHLAAHQARGHHVPRAAFARLATDDSSTVAYPQERDVDEE